MKFGWKTGRGFAPEAGGLRGWWIVWGWLGLEVTPKRWRLGLSATPWLLGLMVGPLTIRLGKPVFRYRVLPQTTNAGAGDCWQDWNCKFVITTGASNTGQSSDQDTKGDDG